MKIAVISDIHGNMDALEAVLEDIKTQKAEKLFICGDLALAGPEPSRTIDFIKNLDAVAIQGNTDEMIANNAKSTPIKAMTNALLYAEDVLTEEQKNYLKDLSPQHSETIEGISILFVHGSPRRNNEDILPNQSVEKIKEIIKDVKEDVIFCGHTHIPCGYQIDKQTVVNVGSVGRPFMEDPKSCYATAEIKDGKIEIIHHLVSYNKELAAEKMRKLPFEEADKIAEMLISLKTRHGN